MMDSDLVMTCSLPSPLVRHQLAYLSINWPHDFHVPRIMYRLSFRLIQPLQLSIIYHNHLSPQRKFHCLLLHSHSLLDHFFLSQGNYKVCPPSLPPHSSSTFSCSFLLFLSLAPCPGFKPNEFFTFPLCLHKHLGMFELLTGVSNGQVARQEAVESTV